MVTNMAHSAKIEAALEKFAKILEEQEIRVQSSIK